MNKKVFFISLMSSFFFCCLSFFFGMSFEKKDSSPTLEWCHAKYKMIEENQNQTNEKINIWP